MHNPACHLHAHTHDRSVASHRPARLTRQLLCRYECKQAVAAHEWRLSTMKELLEAPVDELATIVQQQEQEEHAATSGGEHTPPPGASAGRTKKQ